MKSRIESEKEKKKSEQPEWDRSTNASQKEKGSSIEDKVAKQIASEMLKDN